MRLRCDPDLCDCELVLNGSVLDDCKSLQDSGVDEHSCLQNIFIALDRWHGPAPSISDDEIDGHADVSSLQQKIDTLEAEQTELQTISTQAYDDLGDTEKYAKAVEQENEDLENKVVQLQQCHKKYAEEFQSLKEKVAELENER